MSIIARSMLAFVGSLALGGEPPVPATATHPRVVLAVDGIAQPRNLPVLIAERLGYFHAAGLVVTLVDAPGSPSPAELIGDGRADGAVAYYHHTFMSQLSAGPPMREVALLAVTPDERLLAASRLRGRVRSVRDLKGLRIVTGGTNSGKTTGTTWALLHAGLSATDYVRLPLSSRSAMAEEMSNGGADAIMTHEPDASSYESQGVAFEVADLISPSGTRAALGTAYPATALYFSDPYIGRHRCEVKSVTGALLKALHFIESNTAATIVSRLPAQVVGPDRAAFTRQIAIDKQMFSGDGSMDPAAAAAELRAMAAVNPDYRRVRLSATYTNAFTGGAGRNFRC